MSKAKNRRELEERVGSTLGREMSARTILFHQAMADLAGVTVTDMKCLDYISRQERVTAGDLAQLTGLTTGAITAAIDRLEKAGYASRERDQEDRRKVYIGLCQSPKLARLAPLYEALGGKMGALVKRYSTRELETIDDFMVRCMDVLRELTEMARRERRG